MRSHQAQEAKASVCGSVRLTDLTALIAVPGTPVGPGLAQKLGSRGASPPPSSHTTVRTGPYTAVPAVHASLRCSSRRLTSPS